MSLQRAWWLLGTCAVATSAKASVGLTLTSERSPYDGVVIRDYRTTSPSADVHVAVVDLCAGGVHVEATRAPQALRSTGSWAADEGLQLGSNGDFYKTGPVRVYGAAVGNGFSWPLDQTGEDPGYSWEWFYQHHGWIAFGPDFVTFTHTEQVKMAGLTSSGWRPSQVTPAPPPDTLALVSGFPEVVIDGVPVSCATPTDAACFPDRSDMRDRHPRTAMGLSEDQRSFIVAAVDGRTASSSGMYGAELADLMGQLGAWVAFNVDGGGSSQLWLDGEGYVNNATGNNGGSIRSVANHWGVAAGSDSGRPARPGHCLYATACPPVPPEGGVIDETDACFEAFGPKEYWRTEQAGVDGRLLWTNAMQSTTPLNWAWWRLNLAEAGEYLVEVSVDTDFSAFDAVHYRVSADGGRTDLALDQTTSGGWRALGAFWFDSGGGQHVAVFDDHADPVAADSHVVVDAVRLTRMDLAPDTGGLGADTGATPDSPALVENGSPPIVDTIAGDGAGCGCRSTADRSPSGWLAMCLLVGATRRRARPSRRRDVIY